MRSARNDGPRDGVKHVGDIEGADARSAWNEARARFAPSAAYGDLWVIPRDRIWRGTEEERVLLQAGTSRRYRVPDYPSKRRRARARAGTPGGTGP
jgi:1,2-phenylacetyl-CoA epoxidase PaaB subunit